MTKTIDLNNWNRREHFNFFRSFDDPYIGITTDVDVTSAYSRAKKSNLSFFLYYMYQSIMAVNEVDNFKYRIIDNEVLEFSTIHTTTTIGREDGTFGIAFFETIQNYEDFAAYAKDEIQATQQAEGMRLNDDAGRQDIIHYSTIPWFSFKEMKHEKNVNSKNSIPKITFGKFYEDGKKKRMPVSISVHHGLVDAYHISQYLDTFQERLNR